MSSDGTFSAAQSMAGYLFQCRYALLRCLDAVQRSPNSHVAIERYDDISFENDDFAECLIQAKHNITPKSLSDNSVDLWKTIRVWLHELSNGSVTTDSTRFNLITNSTATDECAMSYLRASSSHRDEAAALKLLRKAAHASTNDTTKNGREAFLKLTEAEALDFLKKIDVLDNEPGLVDVRDEIVGRLIVISQAHADDIADQLEGWWLKTLGKHLTQSALPPIPLQQIIQKINDIGDQFKGDGLLIDDPEALGAPSYSKEDEKRSFVKQMRIVELPGRALQRGVQDYYRASAQRAKWARENLLLDGESGRYDADLCDRWERMADNFLVPEPPATDAQKIQYGQKLCMWANNDAYAFRNVVASWITAGSYHGLADTMRIGWHPEYKSLLGEAEEEALEDA